MDPEPTKKMYGRFAASLGASLVAMYFLAFSQLDKAADFHWSLSVFWISLSMVGAMALVMLVAMWKMLPSKRANAALAAVAALLLATGVAASRTEALVGDDAFLGSMIPHHSRAIHMCQEAKLSDSEVQQLCQGIIASQSREIRQMEDIRARRG